MNTTDMIQTAEALAFEAAALETRYGAVMHHVKSIHKSLFRGSPPSLGVENIGVYPVYV